MSSSSRRTSGAVIRNGTAATARPLDQRELRSGDWTRYGDGTVFGDPATEHTLANLADNVRAAAQAQGYATGWAEGRRKAEAEARELALETAAAISAAEARREAEHRDAVAALELAAHRLHDTVEQARMAVIEQGTDLAYALVRELLDRELSDNAAAAEYVIHRVLSTMPPAETIVAVHLHPSAVDAPAAGALVQLGLELVADATLGLADALVETPEHVLDLRISAALDRVREVLA
jgi:flagellar assembly protein FliH